MDFDLYVSGFWFLLSVFVYHGFMKSISVELEELPWSMVVRKSRPFSNCVSAFTANHDNACRFKCTLIWNDFPFHHLVLISKANPDLAFIDVLFSWHLYLDYGLLMAGLLLTILPVIAFFILMQKHVISGMMQGAIK